MATPSYESYENQWSIIMEDDKGEKSEKEQANVNIDRDYYIYEANGIRYRIPINTPQYPANVFVVSYRQDEFRLVPSQLRIGESPIADAKAVITMGPDAAVSLLSLLAQMIVQHQEKFKPDNIKKVRIDESSGDK